MDSKEFVSLRKTVTTAFGEIAYVEKGSGPAALFVHGVLLNGYLWRDVIEALPDDRRCIAIDLMGHGATRVPDDQDLSFAAQAEMLEAFCDALDLDQVDVIGNDSGGGIAQIFAADHPERIRSMVLTNCDCDDNVFPEAVVPLFDLMKAGALAKAFGPLLDNLGGARASFATTFKHPDRISDETMEFYLRPVLELEASSRASQRWAQALKAEDLSRVTPKLRELRAPTLIVWGTDDAFFDLKWAYWLKDTIAGATRVIEVPGAKLFFPEEQPEMLAKRIREHWAGVPA